jgi:hypothetical protein
MYDQSTVSDLIRFARIDADSTVIDVYPAGTAAFRGRPNLIFASGFDVPDTCAGVSY